MYKELYKRIQSDGNPIFIWGLGALAKDICRFCQKYDIKVQGFFVDIGETQDEFEGLPVYSLEQVINWESDISVILGHHKYKYGTEFLKKFPIVKKTYCLPVVTYGMWDKLERDSVKNEPRWEFMYNGLADVRSRECLKSYLESRISENSECMFPYYDDTQNYYTPEFLHLTETETYLDVGAYVGKAVWMFMDSVHDKYKKIIAVEPDSRNFELLSREISRRKLKKIDVIKACVWQRHEPVCFEGDEELGRIDNDNNLGDWLQAITIDELSVENEISLIKINFSYAVPEILNGAKYLLSSRKPKLIVRVGFHEKLIMDTYYTIKKINPGYAFYFRYTLGMPEGLTLYAV